MRYRDEDFVDKELLSCLEEVQDNQKLRSVVDRIFVIDELYTHSANVAKLGAQLAMDAGLGSVMIHKICLAGILHDAGKTEVPKEILFKPGKLTEGEMAIMKWHPQIGYDLCKPLGVDLDVLDMILHHHEKLDGGGYPENLRTMPIQCRILVVADIFSALVEPRFYHRERSVDDALQFISTFGGLDGDLVGRLSGIVSMPGEEGMEKRT